MSSSKFLRRARPLACLPLALILGACNQAESPAPASRTPPRESVPSAAAVPPADTVYLNGYVYTADAERTVAQAIAVREDRIVFVGSNSDARTYVGDNTRIVGLDQKMILPGLHDAHIHVLGLVQPDACDLNSEPLPLDQLSARVGDCLKQYPLVNGWLMVNQWNFAAGNAAGAGIPTLRAALDAASKSVPIFLRGNDGHHAAVNSAALARATDSRGRQVGLSATTLNSHFSGFREYIGVSADGAPNGALSEGARLLVNPPDLWGLAQMDAAQMPQIAQILAASGITSVQDAALSPALLLLFAALAENREMTFRLTAALLPDFSTYRDRKSGEIQIPRVLADLRATRDQFRGHPLIKAGAAKLFIDGVLEGNPYNDPPTLPNGAVLHPYRQPLFRVATDDAGIEFAGYVDLESEPCRSVQANPAKYAGTAQLNKFRAAHGFHPRQCEVNYGRLEHDETFVRNYMRALAQDGFAIHAHAIGDRAVRIAVANFAALRDEFGQSHIPYTIAHAQLVHPGDRKRIGALGLYVAFTFSWMTPNPPYDLLVTPFINRVKNLDDLYDPRSYMMRNAYPAQSILNAGGIIVAGSDAPVDTRDPRPFFHIAMAISRANQDGAVFNADERISIHDAIAAYTRNAAAALQQESLTGTLAAGKKADLIVLNQNIVELAERKEYAQLAATQVVTT
ncbi:MAG: amidohydrolase family protein, partial [Gammaproteobacteria bacterium]|nr:amidohydrolase family protein [Gammaproteobacteria bacterium]